MILKKSHIIIFLSVISFCVSCEEQTIWDLKSSDIFIVADCIITNELKFQELTLTWSSNEINQESEGITGAIVEIREGNNVVAFKEDSIKQGKYFSVIPFRAAAGRHYMLTIQYNGIFDTAYSQMVGITPLPAIEITKGDSLYHFIYVGSQQGSMTEVFYNWSENEGYCNEYGSCNAMEIFYSLDNIDVSKEFAPEKKIIEFPRNTTIIRKKYSLNQEHQEFIRSLLLETEWRGGIFDVEQGNIPTNFNNGVKGWFAACMVLTDTTYFD